MRKLLFTIYLILIVMLPWQPLLAVKLSSSTTIISRQKISQPADYTIILQTPSGINLPTDTIVLRFAPEFNLSAITVADIDLSSGAITGYEVAKNLALLPAPGVWGYHNLDNLITLTPPTDTIPGEVGLNHHLIIKIGHQAVGGTHQIINPALTGNYVLEIDGNFSDYSQIGLAIKNNDQVTVSAIVPPPQKPPPNDDDGGGTYWVEPDVKPPTVDLQIRPTYLPVSWLRGGKEFINDVRINNSLEGITYPTDYTWESLRSLMIGDNVFYLYSQDTFTKKNSRLVSVIYVRRMIGDTDGDMDVDDFDLAGVAGHWLWDWWQGDFNEDGIVNDFDLAGLASHWTG